MGVPNVVYKWSSLKVLYVTVFVMNVAGFVIVVVMIVSAVNMKQGFGDYLNLVTPGEGYLWPALIVLAAFLCAPIYAVGIRLCFRLKFHRKSPDNLPRFNRSLFIHSVLCFVSVFLVIGITAVNIVHSNTFHHRIHDGLIDAMRNYACEIVAKIRVDMIQIKFHCCGSKSYKEWFYIPWLQAEVDETETRESKEANASQFVSADVPFSCCSTEILKPCIHHNILRPSDVYIYDPLHRLTIATAGCQSKILAHASSVGNLLVFALLLLSVYQMTLALLSRLLQTAHSNTFYIGPKKPRYLAWILGSIPSTEMYNKLVYKNDKPPEDEVTRPSAVDAGSSKSPETIASSGSKSEDRCKNIKNKMLQKLCYKQSSKSNSIDVEGRSSTTLKASGDEPEAGVIPSPPPSPDSLGKTPISPDATDLDGERVSRVSKIARTLESSPPFGDRLSSTLPLKGRKEAEGKRGDKRGGSRDKIKELRETLQHLNDAEQAWKGGSPNFEMSNAPPLDRFSNSSRYPMLELKKVESRRNMRPSVNFPEPLIDANDRQKASFAVQSRNTRDSDDRRGRPRVRVDQRFRRHSRDTDGRRSSSRSSRSRRDGFCQKDLLEEDESRLKKFCKDLSTEYNNSPYSRQRKEYSEPSRWHDRVADGRDIRTQVCAKFNPADAYSRFRGTIQDTVNRREDPMQTRRPVPLIPARVRPVAMRPWSQQFANKMQFLPKHHSYQMPQLPLPLPPPPHQMMASPQIWPQQPPAWSTYCPPPLGYFPQPPRSSDGLMQRPAFSYPYPTTPYPDPSAARSLGRPNDGPRPRFPGRCPMPPGIGEPPRFC